MTDSHLQNSDNHNNMTETPSYCQAHGASSLGPSYPTSSGLPFNVPHPNAQPLPHGMLPEDAMRRETRSFPPHRLGSRTQGPSGNPEGEGAGIAAEQPLFAERGNPRVKSGVCSITMIDSYLRTGPIKEESLPVACYRLVTKSKA